MTCCHQRHYEATINSEKKNNTDSVVSRLSAVKRHPDDPTEDVKGCTWLDERNVAKSTVKLKAEKRLWPWFTSRTADGKTEEAMWPGGRRIPRIQEDRPPARWPVFAWRAALSRARCWHLLTGGAFTSQAPGLGLGFHQKIQSTSFS